MAILIALRRELISLGDENLFSLISNSLVLLLLKVLVCDSLIRSLLAIASSLLVVMMNPVLLHCIPSLLLSLIRPVTLFPARAYQLRLSWTSAEYRGLLI